MLQATSYKLQTKKGFSLLETIVAISILALALSGILSLSSMGIRSSRQAVNQTAAFFLASEAIEYVRNVRDGNVLAGRSWSSGLSCSEPNGCYVDVPNQALNACAGPCPKIRFDGATNLYNHLSGEDTIFTRQILISVIDPEKEAKLTVNIFWPFGGITRNFTLETYIYNVSF